MKWLLPALAVLLTTACASTGAVPRPFPGARVAQGSEGSQGSQGSEGGAGTESSEVAAEAATMTPDLYALVGTALSLRGTPYRNGGSDPSGFDCSGFTQYVFAQYAVALPRGVREQFRQGQAIDSHDLAPGDLVFFATTDPDASHVGIVIGSDQFVHAPSSKGVVRVERLRSSYWSQRYIGARRIAAPSTTP